MSEEKAKIITLDGFTIDIDAQERKSVDAIMEILKKNPQKFSGCPINEKKGESIMGSLNWGINIGYMNPKDKIFVKSGDMRAIKNNEVFCVAEVKIGEDFLDEVRREQQMNKLLEHPTKYRIAIICGNFEPNMMLRIGVWIREWTLKGIPCYFVSDVKHVVMCFLNFLREPQTRILEVSPKIIPINVSANGRLLVAMLMQIDGVSQDYAMAIEAKYDSPSRIVGVATPEAINMCLQEVENKRAELQKRTPRTLTALGTKIYNFFVTGKIEGNPLPTPPTEVKK